MSQIAVSAISRLGDLISSSRVVTNAPSLASYEVDGCLPSAALLPSSSAEIAEILRFASAEGLAVIPTGGKTHLGIGMPPRRYDLALDLSAMNRILAYEPHDLTLGIEPGITCAELDRHLHAKGQFLPLAPSFSERATLGGAVAAPADTPFRYRYGTARDFLLGIEFVTGDGTISKSGGRVVKNVTGYDLHKLFVGSLGTLGVITRLNFRTFPLPQDHKMFLATFPDPAGVFDFCRAIAKSPLHPRLVEAFDPGTAALFATCGSVSLNQDSWFAAVEADGPPAVLARHAHDFESMSKDAHSTGFIALDEHQRNRLFASLSEFSAIAVAATPTTTIFRIPMLPSAMPAMIAKVQGLAKDHGLACASLIRALAVVYVALLPPIQPDAFASLLSASRALFDLCVASGATPVLEHSPLEMKRLVGVWPAPGNTHDIAQGL